MPRIKMALFDWNGTLLNDTPIWYQTVISIFKMFGKQAPTIEEFFRTLEDDYLHVYRKFGITIPREELNKVFDSFYQELSVQARLNENAKSILEILSKTIDFLGIITGQTKNTVLPFLEKYELLDYLSILEYHSTQKSVCINKTPLQFRTLPRECLYVGDTPADIKQARKSGVISIALTNNHIPLDLILAARPDYMITDLSELTSIIKDC